MAKPIQAPPVLTGEAAKQLIEHLEKAQPNPAKTQRNQKDIAFHSGVRRKD